MIRSPGSAAASLWQATIWQDEPAWRSSNGSALAIVTMQRARLIYLGATNGSHNLLNAPSPQVLPTPTDRWPNQGGHRFWLGPQKDWIWPPLREWEFSPAASSRTDGPALILQQPHFDLHYPPITREYAWEGDRLRCTARWLDHGRPAFGMHVIPVDLPFVARARLRRTNRAPAGLVEVTIEGPVVDVLLPHPTVTLNDEVATVRAGVQTLKLGFAVQPLTVERREGWQLSVAPGPHAGIAHELPDHGYLSQIWVGGPEHDLAELEQLTPYLRGNAQGTCASTIYLEAIPPASNEHPQVLNS